MKKILLLILGVIIGLGICEAVFAEEWWEEEGLVEEGEVSEEYLGTVYLEGKFLDGDLLKISALVEDFEVPILGVAFHLEYENELLDFLKYEPGEFLENGGDPFYMVTNEGSKLIFGETLRREDSFPIGEGKVADFYFQILEEDTFDFEFINGVVSTLDVVRQDLDNVEWQTLSITKESEYEEILNTQSGQAFTENPGWLDSNINSEQAVIIALLTAILGFCVVIFWNKYRMKPRKTYVNFK